MQQFDEQMMQPEIHDHQVVETSNPGTTRKSLMIQQRKESEADAGANFDGAYFDEEAGFI